jgi:transposase
VPAKSAGKWHSGRRRHGNIYLQPMLVEIAWAVIGHPGYLKSLYHQHGFESP